MTRLSLIRDFNLFPETEKLLTLERKYGDSLNFEDLNGYPGKPKKKRTNADGSTIPSVTATATIDQNKTTTAVSTVDPGATQQTIQAGTLTSALNKSQGSAIKISEGNQNRQSDKRKADTECQNKEYDQYLLERSMKEPDNFKSKNI